MGATRVSRWSRTTRPSEELQRLKSLGVLGVAWNVTYYGVDYYRDAQPLLEKLVALDMFVNIQVEHDQLVPMMPLLADSGVRVLVDHCGRPTIDAGLDQPGFRALLEMGSTKRAFVKLSGSSSSRTSLRRTRMRGRSCRRWSRHSRSIIACGRRIGRTFAAPTRVDYGVLLNLVLTLFPDASERRKLLWDTPR